VERKALARDLLEVRRVDRDLAELLERIRTAVTASAKILDATEHRRAVRQILHQGNRSR